MMSDQKTCMTAQFIFWTFACECYDLLRTKEDMLSRGYKSTDPVLESKIKPPDNQKKLTKYRWMTFPSCIQFYVINIVLEIVYCTLIWKE